MDADEKAWKIQAVQLTFEPLAPACVFYAEHNAILLLVDVHGRDAVSNSEAEELTEPIVQLGKAPAGRSYARAEHVERKSLRLGAGCEGAKGSVTLRRIDEEHDDVSGFTAPFGVWRAWWIVVDEEPSVSTRHVAGELCCLVVLRAGPP